jgi:excisionase family DNA binding protein
MSDVIRNKTDKPKNGNNMTTWPDGKMTKTVREVADFLDVHPNTVIRWIKSGKIICVRLGRNCIRFTFDQVTEFMKKCASKNGVRPSRI